MLEYYQNLLKKLKKQSRCNSIYNWHKQTLLKMKLNLILIKEGGKNYVQ